MSYLNNSHDGISRDFIESLADMRLYFTPLHSDHRVVEAAGGALIGPARFRGFEKLRVPLRPANRSDLLTVSQWPRVVHVTLSHFWFASILYGSWINPRSPWSFPVYVLKDLVETSLLTFHNHLLHFSIHITYIFSFYLEEISAFSHACITYLSFFLSFLGKLCLKCKLRDSELSGRKWIRWCFII